MSEPTLCPFRHIYDGLTIWSEYHLEGHVYQQRDDLPGRYPLLNQFLVCLQDKCAMWRIGEGHTKTEPRNDPYGKAHGLVESIWVPGIGYCGLAGKP